MVVLLLFPGLDIRRVAQRLVHELMPSLLLLLLLLLLCVPPCRLRLSNAAQHSVLVYAEQRIYVCIASHTPLSL